MKSKWSNIRTPQEQDDSVQCFQMVELVPGDLRRFEGRTADGEEEEPPHDCSDLQRQAFEEGRRKGCEEGIAQVRQELEAQFQHALHLANQMGRARVAALEEQERDIVEVALAVARKILWREIQHDPDLIIPQVQRLLGLLPKKSLVTLRVHPKDLEILQPVHESLRREMVDGDHLTLEADESLEQGGCVIEQGGLLLDASISQQFDTITRDFGIEPVKS